MALKALTAINMWQSNEYFQIINADDNVIANALKIISNRDEYNKLMGYK